MSKNLLDARLTRRSFAELGFAGATASLLAGGGELFGQTPAAGANDVNVTDEPVAAEFYGLDRQLSKPDVKGIYRPSITASTSTAVQHMLFYYDGANGLINPFNVTADPGFKADKKYSFETEISNFHTSMSNNDNLWKNVEDDLQLQLGVSSRSGDDDFTWIALSAIQVFLGGKKAGTDERLATFQAGAVEPTKEFSGPSRIAIDNGSGRLQLQVFAQKRKSIWTRLLNVVKGAVDSPAFGVLPIPKLLSQGVKFTTSVLDHLQAQSRLIPILTSGQIPFRIRKDVSDADFTLRPGTWVAIERKFAMAHVDGNTDIRNFKVNLPGQFYEVTDKNNKPVAADYVVMRFRFPELRA